MMTTKPDTIVTARALLAALTLSLGLCAQARPNVLVIIADDMGYGDLSCYGSEQVTTPNLDALAASGARCTDGYVSASVCAPTRAPSRGSRSTPPTCRSTPASRSRCTSA